MALCVKCGGQFNGQKALRSHKATCGNQGVLRSEPKEIDQPAIKAEFGVLTSSDIKAAKTKDALVILAVQHGLTNKAAAQKWTVAKLKEELELIVADEETETEETETEETETEETETEEIETEEIEGEDTDEE